jgi:hypothetical protein
MRTGNRERRIRILAACLLCILAIACSPGTSTAEKGAWTLSTGVELVSSDETLTSEPQNFATVGVEGDYVVVRMRDFFYHSGKFEHPWLTLPRRGFATLHIGTENPSSLLSSAEEFQRDLTVRIHRKRLPTGTTLVVYNHDTGESVAQYTVR